MLIFQKLCFHLSKATSELFDESIKSNITVPSLNIIFFLFSALCALMLTGNDDCLTEVCRVFGNLTRSKETRDYVLETGGNKELTFNKFLTPK